MMTECWLKSNAKRILLPFRRFSILTIIIIVIIHFPRSPALCAYPGRWCPAIGLKVRTLLLPFVVLSKRWNTPEAICSIDTHTHRYSQSVVCIRYLFVLGPAWRSSLEKCCHLRFATVLDHQDTQTMGDNRATYGNNCPAWHCTYRPGPAQNRSQFPSNVRRARENIEICLLSFFFLSLPPRPPITMQCIGWDRAFIRFLRAVVGSVPFAQQFSKHPAGDWALWCWMQSQQQGDGSALFLLVQWLPRISLAKVLLCCGSIVVDVNSLIDEGTKGVSHLKLSFIL